MKELKKEIRLWLISVLVLKIINIVEKLPEGYLDIKIWATKYPVGTLRK